MTVPKGNRLLTVAVLALLTGTLDLIAAMIINYPATPFQIFRYIASGLFGKEAYQGNSMILWGAFFHYTIAAVFSLGFFELHVKFRMFIKNIYILAVIYGLMIWVIMYFAVLPLTNIPKMPEHLHINWLSIIKNVAALIICLGLPISFLSERYYIRKLLRRSHRRRKTSSTIN